MPVDIKKMQKQKAAQQEARFKGIPIVSAPPLDASLFDQVFSGQAKQVALDEIVPPLEYCNQIWCGGKGEGKTSLIVGNPFGIILKCGDGSSQAPRRNSQARMLECNHFRWRGEGDTTSFEKNFDLVCEYAAKSGENGPHRTLYLDPLATVMFWHMQEIVSKYNEKLSVSAHRNAERAAREAAESGVSISVAGGSVSVPSITSMRDIPGANMELFPKIGEDIFNKYAQTINGLGWGFGACVHYRSTYDPVEKRVTVKPDVPNSCFSWPARYSEIIGLCRKLPGPNGDEFSVLTSVEGSPEFCSRVPFGNLIVPNHSGMPAHLNTWDFVYNAFEEGRAKIAESQAAFEKARNSQQ